MTPPLLFFLMPSVRIKLAENKQKKQKTDSDQKATKKKRLICRRVDNLKVRPPSQISSGVDSWTSPLWYAVCRLVFSFSSARGGRVTLRSPRYVQQPAALSSTNHNTQAELLGENMLPLRPPARLSPLQLQTELLGRVVTSQNVKQPF